MNAKKQLLLTFKELMIKYPIEKISVKDILTKADVGKATFYRYFKDKYDLMNYFFTEYLDELFTFNQYEKGDGYLRAIDALTFFQNNKQFFVNAFKSEGFNNFTDYQYQYYYDKYYALTLEIKGEITPDTDVAIKFYCSGVAFIVKDWIMSGCKMTPQEMSQLIHDFLPIQIPHHY